MHNFIHTGIFLAVLRAVVSSGNITQTSTIFTIKKIDMKIFPNCVMEFLHPREINKCSINVKVNVVNLSCLYATYVCWTEKYLFEN